MEPGSFSDKLALWGVDCPAADSGMLLNFVEKLAQLQSKPSPAKTWEELQSRRAPLQLRLRHSLGLDPWPERTALKAQLMGKIERADYTIEKLVYEAWAGLQVTANLYVPHVLEKSNPGLIYACGHWMEAGKLALPVQSFCASAATLGIITLVYDPIGQGERLESWRDHGHLDMLLVGQSQLGWMVWESIRALDYLLSRPEVNPEKVGMTGASGGGLNTLFTTAIDDRFACAVPVSYPCTFSAAMAAERDLNWEDGTDVCNQVPQVMSYAEMSDISSLFIPKAYMILSGTRDKIFPIAGVRQIATAIEHNYELAGVPEHFRYAEFDEEHGYQQGLREAAYGWLKKWLIGSGSDDPIQEPTLELFPDPYPIGYITPPTPDPDHVRGQSPTAAPVLEAVPGFCFPPPHTVRNEALIAAKIQATAEKFPGFPPLPGNSDDLSSWQEEIKQRIQATLGPFPQKGSLQTRLFNQVWEDGKMAERIAFQSEAGITIPGLLVIPEEWNRPVPFIIYVGEWGKMQGIHSGMIEGLVRAGYGVLAIDVRGVGETATSDFEAATNSLMMDRPLFGQRVLDVVRAVDFVWERCYIAPQIDKGRLVIVGEGVGGLWGLYAAAMDGRVAAVAARNTLYSYSALLKPGTRFPASVYLFDVLKHFDIAHVIAACAPRPVYFHPMDGYRQKCTKHAVATALQPAKEAFSLSCSTANDFQISTSEDVRRIPKWLDKVLNH